MEIKKIALGSQGLVVPNIGLGCMGMTGFEDGHMYGPADEQEAIATIHRSLELGGNFLDTADLYGPFKNEQLLAKAIAGKRDQYIIATKFGWEIDDENKVTWGINGKKEYFRRAIPRFQEAHFHKNIELVNAIEALAAEKQVTSSQLALAWIMSKGIVPIPGTKRRKYLEQNLAAAALELTAEDLLKLESIVPIGTDTGKPYDEFSMGLID
ncbi:MAG: aldo/keto reductase [Pedobacter sp.]|nr:MAG: aldo/keto reductase [Pedobacter sp.]